MSVTADPEHPRDCLLNEPDRLAELCEQIRAAGRVAFDTEFIREESYEPEVCLVQVALEEGFALIDPEGLDLAPLWELVVGEEVETVVFAGRQDFEIAYLSVGKTPRRVFDVQVASGLVSASYPSSYRHVVREVRGVDVGSAETFTDWSRRPLRDEQLRYALEDVIHLLPMHDRYRGDLARLGRESWMVEEMSCLADTSLYDPEDKAGFERVKGHRKLKGRQLAVLDALAVWREKAARRRKIPVRRLLSDAVLCEVARRMPTKVDQLKDFRCLPAGQVRKLGGEIIETVKKGQAVPKSQQPRLVKRTEIGDRNDVRVDLAIAAGKSLCQRARVAQQLFGTRKDYEQLVQAVAGHVERHESALLQGWRGEFLGHTLADVVEGRVGLRIDAEGDSPGVRLIPQDPPGR
jgi:ribonuclease D